MDPVLQTRLEPIARDRRRWRRLRALTRCWLAVAGASLLLLLVSRVAGWETVWVPWLGFALTGFGGLLLVRRRWVEPVDYLALARQIEQENPRLHALLLTAIEQRAEAGAGRLHYLQERVIQDALDQYRRKPWGQSTVERLFFAHFAHLGSLALLVVAMLTLGWPGPPAPASESAYSRGVTVTPGDTSVERGSRVVVLARFHRRLPAEALLVARAAGQPERRWPMTRNLNDPVFGATIPEVEADLNYQVEFAGETTREFQVAVFDLPRLERADARITYPAYTGWPEKVVPDTRRVSAVEGSAVDLTLHLNKPVASATLVPTNGPAITATAASASNVLAARLNLDRSARYQLRLVDAEGRTNKLPATFVLEALSNRPPELKLLAPRGDQRVSPLEEIGFEVEAVDDFGLRSYGLAYSVGGGEIQTIELGQGTGAHQKRAFHHLLPLEDLAAQPDQLVSWFAWADDLGPDGEARRTSSDLFFAEVRPFDEIFREADSAAESAANQNSDQEGGPGARLAELQKQIILATWKLQRGKGAGGTAAPPLPRARRDSRAASAPPSRPAGDAVAPTTQLAQDLEVVREAQADALSQAQDLGAESDDARARSALDEAETAMLKALAHLSDAVKETSTRPLPAAVSAEQAAYQALLKLAGREFAVSRGRAGQQRGGGGSPAQRQLDQLELKQAENRYETQREASPLQDPAQRESLRVQNRLKELAQRQQTINERLQELQTALQEAKTPEEREEIRRRLQRLREEEQELLADLDELRQRLEQPETQSRLAEARQQLEQTRADVQRAAEALEEGSAPPALAAGTRAQRQLQQVREDLRQDSASQFTDEMRQLRNDARQLAQREEEIGKQLEDLAESKRKTLSDTDSRTNLATRLEEQQQRLKGVLDNATEVSRQAEEVEPLLARQLIETLRQAREDDARAFDDTTQELLDQGRLLRSVYDELTDGRRQARTPVESTSRLLRGGFAPEASELEQRARRGLNALREGVERAAESVLGNDAEALRLAQRELDQLSQQVEQEIAQAETGSEDARQPSGQPPDAGAQPPDGGAQPPDAGGQRPDAGEAPRGASRPTASAPRAATPTQARSGGSPESLLEQLSQATESGTGGWRGPIVGRDYGDWADRLRDVEELLDTPELRTEAARIRERARSFRVEFKRHGQPPQWSLVKLEVAAPLAELRSRVAEELARRQSAEALVPLDRDPVPVRYSELVRRYYERLGKSE